MRRKAILIGLGWLILAGIVAPFPTWAGGHYEDGIFIPDGVCVQNCGNDVPSTYRDDDPPRVERQREEEPKPPSRAELKQRKVALERQQAHTQQIKGELARLSKGFQIQRAQPTIELTPRDNNYFYISPDSGESPFGQIMVATLSGIGTPASRIPLENLRRAAAIMQAFLPGNIGSMSEEDMSYLAGQSALAMEGAPLSVEIREFPAGREDDTRRLVQQAQDIETVRAAAERATTERLRVEEQLVKVQNDLQSGKGDTEGLKSQREIVLQSYKAAYIAEAKKKAEVHDMTVRIVWEGVGHGVSP